MIPVYDDLKIEVSTSILDLGFCTNAKLGVPQTRYYVINKQKVKTLTSKESRDINGNVLSPISKTTYTLLKTLLKESQNTLAEYRRQLNEAIQQRDSYKFMIDTLRSNGIID